MRSGHSALAACGLALLASAPGTSACGAEAIDLAKAQKLTADREAVQAQIQAGGVESGSGAGSSRSIRR